MNVDIDFEFAKIYNIYKQVDVVIGQKFSLFTDSTDKVNFASINDAALKLTESDTSFDAEATAVGNSVILIMDANFGILKQLVFNVVGSITEPANNLGATADLPQPK